MLFLAWLARRQRYRVASSFTVVSGKGNQKNTLVAEDVTEAPQQFSIESRKLGQLTSKSVEPSKNDVYERWTARLAIRSQSFRMRKKNNSVKTRERIAMNGVLGACASRIDWIVFFFSFSSSVFLSSASWMRSNWEWPRLWLHSSAKPFRSIGRSVCKCVCVCVSPLGFLIYSWFHHTSFLLYGVIFFSSLLWLVGCCCSSVLPCFIRFKEWPYPPIFSHLICEFDKVEWLFFVVTISCSWILTSYSLKSCVQQTGEHF